MAKISDEIRDFIDEEDLYPRCIAELRRIADRIDNEMIELPKDADGVPIHVGDTVWGCNSGMKVTIEELRMTDVDRWTITTNKGFIPQGSGVTHENPDSFERIADELEEWREDNRINGSGEIFDRAADFADRIRRLAQKEGDYGPF